MRCPVCDKEFFPRDPRQKCCSKPCGEKRYTHSESCREKRRRRYRANKKRWLAARRKRYRNDPAYREKIVSAIYAWRKANPERAKEIGAKHRDNPERRERARKVSRAWHKKNRETANVRRKTRKQSERTLYPWKGPLDAAIRRAKDKGLPCDLTHEWAQARWTGRCELSGVPFRVGERGNGPKFFAASIDQIRPKGGYTKTNSRFVLWCVNAFKYDGSDADVLMVAKAICEKHGITLSAPRGPTQG